jgi:pyruvate dehydrogenase E1 component alpha subunit
VEKGALMPIREIERFSVSYMQVLDEHGKVDAELEPDLSQAELTRLYRAMVLAREADQRMLKLQRQGRIGTFGPSTGQEAAVCGPTLAMTEKDWFVGAFRELGAQLMRGMPLSSILLFYNGFEEGNVRLDGACYRTTPVSIVVGSQTLHAVGMAYAMKYRGEKDSAAVTFFGDGATSEGDVYEAMNFAAVWQAPVVFICQNNQWAISVRRKQQTYARTLAQKAIACEMPTIQVDGNDALAMYKATKEALDRAHAGKGPSFIEAVTYRLLMHTTADDPSKYRPEEEVQEAWKKEPLSRFRAYLTGKGIWNDDKQAALATEIKGEIDAAVAEFESQSEFKLDACFDHAFGTRHQVIEQQRAEFLANLLAKEAADA